MGSVLSIRPCPPPCPQLHRSAGAAAALDVHVRMRLAVQFASGVFGVIEVDSGGRLRTGVAPPQVRWGEAGRGRRLVPAADGVSLRPGAPAPWRRPAAAPLRGLPLHPLLWPRQICAQRVGSALDIGWVPLPWPIGGGSVLGVALRDGSLAFVETCQVRAAGLKAWGWGLEAGCAACS
jgi:hypothetical protein